MPSNNTNIDDLVLAASRAKKTGRTDTELREIETAKRIGFATSTAANAEAATLSPELILRSITITLGSLIRINRNGGPKNGFLIALPLIDLILEIATEDQSEDQNGDH